MLIMNNTGISIIFDGSVNRWMDPLTGSRGGELEFELLVEASMVILHGMFWRSGS